MLFNSGEDRFGWEVITPFDSCPCACGNRNQITQGGTQLQKIHGKSVSCDVIYVETKLHSSLDNQQFCSA